MLKKVFYKATTRTIDMRFIQEIYNLIPFIKMIKSINKKDTLVIFDVDHVLIKPTHDYDFRHQYRAQLLQQIKSRYSKKHFRFLESIIIFNKKYHLVDLNILNILNYLQDYQIPTIALTALSTGKFGTITKMEDLRIANLKNMNIDFTELSTIKDYILADKLAGTNMIFPDCIGIPMLKAGIIFTAGVNKGIVLEYILDQKHYYPKTIIFIDDDLHNLQALEKLCIKLQITFYGFHYQAVSLMPLPKINEDLEKLRFKVLETEHNWLSYTESLIYHKKNTTENAINDNFISKNSMGLNYV